MKTLNTKSSKPNTRMFEITNETLKAYVKELQEKHNITLSYGDLRFKYNVKSNILAKQLRTYIDDSPYYVSYVLLPEAECGLKDIRLCYSSLHQKYVITSYDENYNLCVIEYLEEKSVKDLLKLIDL